MDSLRFVEGMDTEPVGFILQRLSHQLLICRERLEG
jgi:hypothetical protein